jgi:hypothetical protein
MEIFINGNPSDITLEAEKTVGEVLTGVEEWLIGTDNRISGVEIDGKNIDVDEILAIFELDLSSVTTLNIVISTFPELAIEALAVAEAAVRSYENVDFEEKRLIRNGFETCSSSNFLKEQIPDIANVVLKTLNGEFSPFDLYKILDERIREFVQPKQETEICSKIVSEVAARLEDFPLDMQTGKDKRAMETIQLFSHIAEKLFRLLAILKYYGYETDAVVVDSVPIGKFIEDFGAVLKEMLETYAAQDTVLTGDLAEYEMAPRLLSLYSAIKDLLSS